jgi:hypothetical protein
MRSQRRNPEATRSIHAIAAEHGEMLRQIRVLPPEVTVSDDAGVEDRFLALIGRQPRDRRVLVG